METIIEKTTIVTFARAEYIEVEPNVHLHVTDAGEGRPIVLIPGWPLSDEMYDYKYNDQINNSFRVIGITLRELVNRINLTASTITIYIPQISGRF